MVQVPVATSRPALFPDLDGAYPSYFIYGPMVFSTVTAQFSAELATISQNRTHELFAALSVEGSPIAVRRGDHPAFPGETLVMISSPLFPGKFARGYGNPVGSVVKSVNGIAIKNLDQLVEVLRDATSDFIEIEFWAHFHENLVFRRADVVAATDAILTDNGIRSQGSADTMAVWNAKPVAAAAHP